jgi:hypothetical protein
MARTDHVETFGVQIWHDMAHLAAGSNVSPIIIIIINFNYLYNASKACFCVFLLAPRFPI